jgi:hypothetical protein
MTEQVRAEVDRLAAQVATLTSVVVGLGTLADKVTVLSERVTELAARRPEERSSAGRTSWFEATPEQAEVMLRDLASWVDSVLWNYRSVEIQLSDCWYRHPAVVEALLASQGAWRGAYQSVGIGSATAAVDWHHRHLPGTANLLRDELRGCSELNHRPGGSLASNLRPESRTPVEAARLREYARAWALNHRPPP